MNASSKTPSVRPGLIPALRPRFALPRALARMEAALQEGRVTNDGPWSRALEAAAAEHLGVSQVLAVSSGSMALLLAATALGRRGKFVLPSFTYMATASAFLHAGLEPLFCDVEPEGFTLSPAHLAELLARHPEVSVVVPVNVYGLPPALSEIGALAEAAGAAVVYDSAHGMAAQRDGVAVPPEATATAFSLHATKICPAVEGGLLVCRDPALFDVARSLRGHGLWPDPLQARPGFNARMDELRSCVGLDSLEALPAALARRTAYARRLLAVAADAGGFYTSQRWPAAARWGAENLALRCALPAGRDAGEVVAAFARRGVEVRRYFHPPLHHMQRFAGARLPVTDELWRTLVCLPLWSDMPEGVLEHLENAIVMVARELS